MALKGGLMHGPQKIEVEDVKMSMRKPCCVCGIIPEGRRLRVTMGGGRHANVFVYCKEHGVEFMEERALEAQRAAKRLQGAPMCIRDDAPDTRALMAPKPPAKEDE